MIFGGVQTANVWEEVLLLDNIRVLDAGLVGLAGSLEWPVGNGGVTVGIEGQIVQHVGRQTHLEVNVPAIIRYRPENPWKPVDSLAFGFGLSHATETPALEIEREGRSRRTMFYWTIEVAFRTSRPEHSVVLRLHHRSTGYGVFGDSGGSNAIAAGVRRQF